MSAKRYKLATPSSLRRIRKAQEHLEAMPSIRQIEPMVAAGAMTEKQAERAREKLAETQD